MQPRSAAVGFPKEPHYKLLWFRLWLGNSTQALMPRPPRPTPQCSRLSQSESVSRIASLLSSQCLPLPFVIAGNYLSKGGSFLYWGFLQSCSAASSDKREAPAPGSLSRIHVLVCSLHSRQLPGPGRRPNKSPAPHHSESPGTLHGTLTPSKQDSSQVQSHRGLCLVNVGT